MKKWNETSDSEGEKVDSIEHKDDSPKDKVEQNKEETFDNKEVANDQESERTEQIEKNDVVTEYEEPKPKETQPEIISKLRMPSAIPKINKKKIAAGRLSSTNLLLSQIVSGLEKKEKLDKANKEIAKEIPHEETRSREESNQDKKEEIKKEVKLSRGRN
jgi:hypothetical protein